MTWKVSRSRDGSEWVRLGGTWVRADSRKDFFGRSFNYLPGEHIGVYGPTQTAGKTSLLFDAYAAVDTSYCAIPPTFAITKPADPTLARMIPKHGLEEISQWPPRRRWFRDPPPGYAFWPRHDPQLSAAANNLAIAGKFNSAINDMFFRRNTIYVVDELYHYLAMLKQHAEIDRHLTQGHGMGSALWFGTQKPSGTHQATLSGFVFNSPTHTFVARDPVKSNRVKFAEIGGVNPDIITEATFEMPKFYFLYIHRDGPRLCIVKDK